MERRRGQQPEHEQWQAREPKRSAPPGLDARGHERITIRTQIGALLDLSRAAAVVHDRDSTALYQLLVLFCITFTSLKLATGRGLLALTRSPRGYVTASNRLDNTLQTA